MIGIEIGQGEGNKRQDLINDAVYCTEQSFVLRQYAWDDCGSFTVAERWLRD